MTSFTGIDEGDFCGIKSRTSAEMFRKVHCDAKYQIPQGIKDSTLSDLVKEDTEVYKTKEVSSAIAKRDASIKQIENGFNVLGAVAKMIELGVLSILKDNADQNSQDWYRDNYNSDQGVRQERYRVLEGQWEHAVDETVPAALKDYYDHTNRLIEELEVAG